MAELIKGVRPRLRGKVEIVRSFAYKLNVGNYESRDFFCSQKCECDAADADEISEAVYQFCKREVMRAVQQYMEIDKLRRAS